MKKLISIILFLSSLSIYAETRRVGSIYSAPIAPTYTPSKNATIEDISGAYTCQGVLTSASKRFDLSPIEREGYVEIISDFRKLANDFNLQNQETKVQDDKTDAVLAESVPLCIQIWTNFRESKLI